MTDQRSEIISRLKNVLENHPEVPLNDLERLRITENLVMEAMDGESPISDAILDAFVPRADTTKEYVHYTRFETLPKVVANGMWRLYWVYNRILDDEYRPFCEKHNLTGYLENEPTTGRPKYETMCKDLFYTSLTRHPSDNENQMWEVFGDRGRGVRFVFRVEPVANRSHFRPVKYQGQAKKIIQELQNVAITFNRKLILNGISRIGAFYLPMRFNIEQEYRILIKRFRNIPADPWNVQTDGNHEYISIPLNKENELCNINLIRVDAGKRRRQREVNQELMKNELFSYLAPKGCFGFRPPWDRSN